MSLFMHLLGMLPGRGEGCPHCGSLRKPIMTEDETFLPRKGCLDCDQWWGPPRLRTDSATPRGKP